MTNFTTSFCYETMRKCTVALSAICVLSITLTGCNHKSKEADISAPPQLPAVTVAPVISGGIEETLAVTGTLAVQRDREALLSPAVSGVIDSLTVRLGDRVFQGQPVAHLSTVPLLGQIQQAQSAIAQNQVQVQQAEANALQQRAATQSGVAQAQSAVAQVQATLLGAQATLQGDQAAVANAQKALDRSQELTRDGLVARKDVEAAELTLQSATALAAAQEQSVAAQQMTVAGQKSALDAAKAAQLQDIVKRKDVEIARQQVSNAIGAMKTAQGQLALYTLRTPISGIVSSVGASIGESVDTTAKVVTIVDLRVLQLQLSIPVDSARGVRAGEIVTFTTGDSSAATYSAVLKVVAADVDPSSNTIQATALVDNPNGALTNGEFVRARIVLKRREGVCLVPKSALLRDDSGSSTAAVVGSDDTLHVVPVTTGVADGSSVEIVRGVHPGQKVATVGAYGLPDGAKVSISNGGAAQ